MWPRLSHEERGVALVEFALVAPILLVLLFGMLDFGRVFNYWIDATHLLVLASERIDANPFGGGPVLYVVDLAAATVTRYAGPSVPYDDFEAVRAELDRKMKVGNRDLDFASI